MRAGQAMRTAARWWSAATAGYGAAAPDAAPRYGHSARRASASRVTLLRRSRLPALHYNSDSFFAAGVGHGNARAGNDKTRGFRSRSRLQQLRIALRPRADPRGGGPGAGSWYHALRHRRPLR